VLDYRTERARVGDSGASRCCADGYRLSLGFALGLLWNQDRVGIPVRPHTLDAENRRKNGAGSESDSGLKMRIST
jgi:hypothetical protein